MTRADGSSLPELVVLLCVVSLVTQWVANDWVQWRQRRRVEGASETLALVVSGLRLRAAATGTAHGIVFDPEPGTAGWFVVADGDGDGIRSADVRSGVDAGIGLGVALDHEFPGVTYGLPPSRTTPGGDPGPSDGIALGVANILAVSPAGSTSSGSVYLRDAFGNGSALRLYGPTGRAALWVLRRDQDGWRRRW